MQPQDKGEDDRSEDNSVDGESLVFTHTNTFAYKHMYCNILYTCTIVLHSMTSLPDFAAELLLNVIVDDNCSCLDYLVAELVKLQEAG